MDSSAQFMSMVHEALAPETCSICGNPHDTQHCDYIKIERHVLDTSIPSRAKLTLPSFLDVQVLIDGTHLTLTRATISKGTQFGPFQAEKTQTLQPTVFFPLKLFSLDENGNCEWYLDNNNEEKCSWMMFVGPAEFIEEQNLICYQEKDDIYYVTIKDINEGDALKVWYSPYYASKMNKSALLPKSNVEEPSKDVDVNSLIKKQQKVQERKAWTCKFCTQIENNIVSFARHILKHYTAQQRNMCEICKKTFGSKKHLKNHMKIVHSMTSPPKPAKVPNPVPLPSSKDPALGGPLLNDMFTDSSDLQHLNEFDLNIDNQNLLLDNDNLNVENLLNENVKDLDHFNFEIDDSQKQFVCDICLKQFSKVKCLIIHLRHHTGDFICYKCLKIFCRKENLNNHTCNVTTYHRCTLCEQSFPAKKYLMRHMQGIHNKKFGCISCNKHYYSNKELLEHNCSKIPNSDKEKFICPVCSKVFYRDLYLKKHLRTHSSCTKSPKSSTATCEICGQHLSSKKSYYSHKKIHEDPAYECEICHKKFTKPHSLKEHGMTHQDTRQYECNTCQKRFKSKKILNCHSKKHNSSYSVKCPNCEMIFKSRSSLNKHSRNFHSEKKKNIPFEYYSCPICDKSIKLKSSVLRHLRKIHGDVTNVDLSSVVSKLATKKADKAKKMDEMNLENEMNSLLNSAENNTAIQKQAVDSLVEELDLDGKKGDKREVCLSIPELSENYQEITLDKNAYILENGTIVQPQQDSDNVIIYVLDQTFS